jgi:hypothetical protein
VKLLKLFGLAALAALMAMAFVGAGSAMATGSTALCKDMPDVEDGVCDDPITHVHETTLSGAKAKLLSSAINVECDVLFLGNALLGLIIGKFTYTNCNSKCFVTQEGTVTISALRLSHETADVTGEGQVHVACGSLIDCKYNGRGLVGTGKGPLLSTHLNGEVALSEQTTNRVGGAFCPSTAKLDITTTPLELVYIGVGHTLSAETTALCEDMPTADDEGLDGTDGVCDDPITHVHETTLSGAKAKLLSSVLNVECDVLFLGDVLGLANPQVIHSGQFTYTNCNSGCVVTQEGTVLIKVLKLGHETAQVTGEGQVHVECGSFIDCTYNGTGLVGAGKGPLLSTHLNGEVTLTEEITNRVGGAFCPSTAELDITTTPLTHTYIGS